MRHTTPDKATQGKAGKHLKDNKSLKYINTQGGKTDTLKKNAVF